MRKNYRITRKADFTEFDDLVNQGVAAHCVEQNSTTLTAPSQQTRNNRMYRFYQWSDGNTDTARTVSAADNIEFTARYKYPTHTTNSQAMTANGSRKILRSDDGSLHLVYESMNRIWYERSTDNGTTWSIMNGGKPLRFTDSKCPAIAELSDYIAIVFQEKDGTGSKLRLQVFYPEQDSLFRDTLFSFQDAGFTAYANDMNPAIVWGENSRCMVMMEGFLSSYPQRGVGYIGLSLGANNNFVPNGVTYGTLAGSGSARPAIFYPSDEQAVALRDTFHVAWQQSAGSNSQIKYLKMYYDSTGQLGMTTAVALQGGYAVNTCPSIIGTDSSARVVWITEDPEIGDSRTLQLRDPKNPTRTWLFGSNVSSPTINRQLDRSYFLGWSQPYGTGWNNYWLNNSLSSAQIFQIPDVNGRYMQMTNNGDLSSTRAVVLTGSSVPYAFTTVPLMDLNAERELLPQV